MKKCSIVFTALLLTGLSTQSTTVNASGVSKFISNAVVEAAIEIEAGFSNNYADENTSDITVATIELVIDSKINDKISVHILLLHEEDETTLEVDEASISFDLENGYSLMAGQLYLPLGNYETNMISNSLPHEFSEVRETAIQLDITSGAFTSSFYVFNGDVLENGANDSIESMGFNIAYTTDSSTFGFSFINNLSDGDLITDVISTTVSYVSGISIYATTTFGQTSVFFEYISAMDEFDVADLSISTTNQKPSTLNLELGFELKDAVFAVAYQTSSEAVDFELPETRFLVSYSMNLMKNTSLAFELTSDTNYSIADGGTGENASALTTQLAIAF